MWPIAIETLIADRGKLLTALVGVIFSVVLVNIQGGLFVGLIRKASLLVEASEADIWVGHRDMHNVDFPRDIPRRWLHRIEGIPGVETAESYIIGMGDMTLPGGGWEEVVVVGVDPSKFIGHAWNFVEGGPNDILRPNAVILDQCELGKLRHPAMGEVREISGLRARIVGLTHGIMGFLVTPYVFTTHDRAARFAGKRPDVSSYFLVKVKPGVDVQSVCDAIHARIPEVDALPKEEYGRVSINFWMTRTGLGISFGAATLLGLAVGMIMVAQTLYALILDRLGEYGTLKAIGASENQVYTIVIAQAVLLALVGSLIGLLLVAVIQHAYSTPRAPIVVPYWLSLGSCALVTVMCLVSSMLPYLRIRKIDPVMVLQS